MSARFQIAILVFMMAQAILFGIGAVLVLKTPFAAFAMLAMPWVVGVNAFVSVPLSWMVALRLRKWLESRTVLLAPSIIPYGPRT
jgi:hypothetical protein